MRSLDCCDQFDLERVRMLEELGEVESNSNGDSCSHTEMIVLSCMLANLQDRIKLAVESNTQETLHTVDEKKLLQKKLMTMVDRLVEDEMGDIDQKETVVTGIGNLIEEYFDKNTIKWGTNGGGAGRLELYRHTGATAKKQKRMRGVV